MYTLIHYHYCNLVYKIGSIYCNGGALSSVDACNCGGRLHRSMPVLLAALYGRFLIKYIVSSSDPKLGGLCIGSSGHGDWRRTRSNEHRRVETLDAQGDWCHLELRLCFVHSRAHNLKGYGGYARIDVRESDGYYSYVYAVEYICVMWNLQYGSVRIGRNATPMSTCTNTCALMRWWSITLVTDTCISLPPDLTPTLFPSPLLHQADSFPAQPKKPPKSWERASSPIWILSVQQQRDVLACLPRGMVQPPMVQCQLTRKSSMTSTTSLWLAHLEKS